MPQDQMFRIFSTRYGDTRYGDSAHICLTGLRTGVRKMNSCAIFALH